MQLLSKITMFTLTCLQKCCNVLVSLKQFADRRLTAFLPVESTTTANLF